MIEKIVTIKIPRGLHTKVAAVFVREAEKFKSRIFVAKDGLQVNGKSVLGLLLLAAEKGSRLTIKADGADETKALEALDNLFKRAVDEEDF